MNDSFENVRKWLAVVCFTTAASIFWGAIAAAIAKYAFDLTSGWALVAVGLPVGVCMGIFLLPRLRKLPEFR